MDPSRPQCHRGWVTRMIEVDYLVVGAGAMGTAFTDALVDHAAVRVALVDRRLESNRQKIKSAAA